MLKYNFFIFCAGEGEVHQIESLPLGADIPHYATVLLSSPLLLCKSSPQILSKTQNQSLYQIILGVISYLKKTLCTCSDHKIIWCLFKYVNAYFIVSANNNLWIFFEIVVHLPVPKIRVRLSLLLDISRPTYLGKESFIKNY